jgi:hypothetical protein
MQIMSENQQVLWRPSFPATPRGLRIIPMSGADAMEWTTVAARCVAEEHHQSFANGTALGMNEIKCELLLPLDRELPVHKLLSCFASATTNRRATKLSRILHLVHSYPGVPMVHRGLRFVTASLWASYAELGLEGEEDKLQSARIKSAANSVWATLGWKVANDCEKR